MKIRNALVITTAVAAALSVSGCGPSNSVGYSQQPVSVCTDQFGRRVQDSYCSGGYYGHGGLYHPIYLGSGGYVPSYGSPVRGGTTAPVVGRSYAPSSSVSTFSGGTSSVSSVSRGGFGSSVSSFSGGFSAGE